MQPATVTLGTRINYWKLEKNDGPRLLSGAVILFNTVMKIVGFRWLAERR